MGGRKSVSTKKSRSVLEVVFLASSLGESKGGGKEEEEGWEEKSGEGEHDFRRSEGGEGGGKGGEAMRWGETLPELPVGVGLEEEKKRIKSVG